MDRNVLVVDDEPGIYRLVKEILSLEDFEVSTASCGQEALEKMKENDIDLALVDIFMPEMDGWELVEKIREDPELEDVKVIFLTIAEHGEVDQNRFQNLGILDLIHKPFHNREVVQGVKKAIA